LIGSRDLQEASRGLERLACCSTGRSSGDDVLRCSDTETMKKSREVLESGRIAQVQMTKIAERIDLLLERLARLTKLNF
jgi:hypothetical protein